MDFLMASGQRSQQWQEITQKEIGQTRADLVEGQGRLIVLELFI